jgi:glutathione synthase/RimK-type ligase-like ATP-grasp enzyme
VLLYNASPEEIEVGQRALDVVGYPTEYARLDMIPGKDGPTVIEVELIDPMMFFDHQPETAEAYADHIENYFK